MRATMSQRMLEVARAVQRQHRAQLLAGERVRRRRRRLPRPSGMRGLQRRDVGAGRRAAAIARADWPVTAADSLPSGHISCCSAAFCAASSSTRAARAQRGEHRRRAPRRRRPGCSPTSSWWRCRRSWSAAMRSAAASTSARLVDDAGHVAGADAEGRRAAGVARRARWPASRWPPPGRTGASARPCEALLDRRRQHLHQVARRADAVELRVDELEQPRRRCSSPWATAPRSPRCGPSAR